MKRLLKITFDAFIFSFIPIVSWFALGLLVDENLVNVFTLTYPIQFIYGLLRSIFAVGANIHKEKNNDKNIVMSSMIVGTIVSLIIFGLIAINIDSYITFMNMDINTYHNFTIYSVIQLYLQLIFSFIIEKLYYEDKNTLANKYMLSFNLLNLIVLIITSIIFKNQFYIILITLLSIFIYLVYIFIRQFDKFDFKFKLIPLIKYESVDICDKIFFFLIYVFGISNTASFGIEYITAMNFVTLLTDTQWDAFDAISTVAKIDISKKCFNYKQHLKNAYKLLGILFISITLLFILMLPFKQVNLTIVFIYIAIEVFSFLIYPAYIIKTYFLQLEHSSIKTTTNKFITSVLRTSLSFLKTPFCTGIGQVCSCIYQFITINIIFKNNYKIEKNGTIIRK